MNATEQPPKLGYVIVYVPDVARAVSFYERAFGVQRRFIHESGTYAEMETGATALAFADEVATASHGSFEANRGEKKSAGAEVAFVVGDVPAAFAQAIKSGAAAVIEPVDKPWVKRSPTCVTSTGSLSRFARPSTAKRPCVRGARIASAQVTRGVRDRPTGLATRRQCSANLECAFAAHSSGRRAPAAQLCARRP